MEPNFIEYQDTDGEMYRYDTNIRDDSVAGHPVQMTSFHSVIDSRWSTNYILLVQQAEREVGHEICGAKTSDDSPCKAYPMKLEDEPYPDEIGRCNHHRQSMNISTDVMETATSEKSLPATFNLSPIAKSLIDIAHNEFFQSCGSCINRVKCEEAGTNNSKCVKEQRLFEGLLNELMQEYDLDSIADSFTSVSLVDTMIKMIRTSSYEGQYGLIEAINSGTAKYNLELKKMLNSTLKMLGMDRKTRITVRHATGKVESFDTSLAKALSSVKVDEVELRSATMKVSKQEASEPVIGRTGPPIDIYGNEIKDDEPIE